MFFCISSLARQAIKLFLFLLVYGSILHATPIEARAGWQLRDSKRILSLGIASTETKRTFELAAIDAIFAPGLSGGVLLKPSGIAYSGASSGPNPVEIPEPQPLLPSIGLNAIAPD
jgi:hypothetical protein